MADDAQTCNETATYPALHRRRETDVVATSAACFTAARLFGRIGVVYITDTPDRRMAAWVLPCSQATLPSGTKLGQHNFYKGLLQRISRGDV